LRFRPLRRFEAERIRTSAMQRRHDTVLEIDAQ
jgi:hypothetical protein